MKAALENYHARMLRVLDHIDRHLDADLGLAAISTVAAFSKFHFHRQFTATFGLPVHRYVQLARMKRASYRLAYRDAQSVTGIAIDAGYEAPDAFARAFRQHFGQSPSAFRKSPDWEPWLRAFGPFDTARSKLMQQTFTAQDVCIRDVPPTAVAIMEHRGDPATIGATIQRFIAWRQATGLTPKTYPTFNIFHSDPGTTSPADYRLDLCVATNAPIDMKSERIEAGLIPGGRCAVLRVVGNTDNLEPAARYLYRHWLPASGEEARDFPLYCQRVSLFPDVPDHESTRRPVPALAITGFDERLSALFYEWRTGCFDTRAGGPGNTHYHVVQLLDRRPRIARPTCHYIPKPPVIAGRLAFAASSARATRPGRAAQTSEL